MSQSAPPWTGLFLRGSSGRQPNRHGSSAIAWPWTDVKDRERAARIIEPIPEVVNSAPPCLEALPLTAVEVRLFPNSRRPGVGLRPRREGQRPLLPQHARHCPVLEAGSAVGLLVHPPLAEKEAFQIGYEGEGRYQFDYSVNAKGNKWEQ